MLAPCSECPWFSNAGNTDDDIDRFLVVGVGDESASETLWDQMLVRAMDRMSGRSRHWMLDQRMDQLMLHRSDPFGTHTFMICEQR